MDKQQFVKSILKTVEQEVNEWFDEKDLIKDPIEYERRLLERSLNFGKTLLLESGGKIPRDRNAKKKS